MSALLASHFLAGSILSLVLPVGVIIVVLTWYWIVWRRGSEERVKGRQAAPRDLAPSPGSTGGDASGAKSAAGDPPPTA
jgi:hypothetical protein